MTTPRLRISMTGLDLKSRAATIEELAPMLADAQRTASLYAHRGPEDYYRAQALAHVSDLTAQIEGLGGKGSAL